MLGHQIRLVILDLFIVAATMLFVVAAVKVATLPTTVSAPAPARVEAKCRCTFCPTHKPIDTGDLPRR